MRASLTWVITFALFMFVAVGEYTYDWPDITNIVGVGPSANLTMPRGVYRTVPAYDPYNDIIYIIGGSRYNDNDPPRHSSLMSFNITQWNADEDEDPFTDYGRFKLNDTHGCFAVSQRYTQIDNILYMINSDESAFSRLVLSESTASSNQFPIEYRWNNISSDYNLGYHSCLCQYEDYLIIGNSSSMNILIYDISNDVWIENAPSKTPVDNGGKLLVLGYSCNVHPVTKYMYIIGGSAGWYDKSYDSIEKLYVGDMNNIGDQSWEIISDKLSFNGIVGRYLHRSVVYGDSIYVIGGYATAGRSSGSAASVYVRSIDVINVLTDTVTSNNGLNENWWNTEAPGVILVNSRVYIFGIGRYRNNWEYFDIDDLRTLSPTKSPTVSPTREPNDGSNDGPNGNLLKATASVILSLIMALL